MLNVVRVQYPVLQLYWFTLYISLPHFCISRCCWWKKGIDMGLLLLMVSSCLVSP